MYAFQHTFLYNFLCVRQTCRFYKKTIDPDFCSIIAQNLHCNHGSTHPLSPSISVRGSLKNKMLSWYLSFFVAKFNKAPHFLKSIQLYFFYFEMVNNYVGKWKQRRTVGVPGSKRGHNQQGKYVDFVLKFKGFYSYLKYWKIYIEIKCNLLLF